MRPRFRLLACVPVGLLAACASFPPPPVVRVNGYDGPTLPRNEVATVYILDGRPHYEAGFICGVDGKPTTPGGGCASVVYLMPGIHSLAIRYQSRIEYGSADINLRVQAGKLYQLNATSFRTRNTGMVELLSEQEGRALSHRNVAPGMFSAPQLDEPLPYGPSK